MKDVLIYKNQAIRDLKELQTVLAAEGDPFLAGAMNRPIGCLEGQPEVDAVDVVRCKDCEHRADALECGSYLCNRKMIGMVRPNDFCSFGERRTDGKRP